MSVQSRQPAAPEGSTRQPQLETVASKYLLLVTEGDVVETVRAAALLELAGGPLPLGDLATRLNGRGLFAVLDGLDDGDLAEALDEILLDSDDTWMSVDGTVASTAALLDGAVFSHRPTEAEWEHGVLHVTPDLGAIDFDAGDGLEFEGGGKMELCFPSDGEAGPDENGSYVGPTGWLAPCHAGEVVCLRPRGGTVSVEIGASLGSGRTEEEALRRAFEARRVEGVGVEPHDLVMEALCHDPTLFQEPVAPVGELLDRVGLERRGAWMGRRGEDWEPPGFRFMARERSKLATGWGFGPCCDDAFDTVLEAWGDQVITGRRVAPLDIRTVARALSHGSVAPAFCEYVLGGHDHGSETLRSLAAVLSSAPGKLAAPGLFLQALESERSDETLAAEAHVQRAVLADPDYGLALAELAWYAADRGDGGRAASLLRRAGVRADDPELDFLSSLPAAAVKAGRNDPCPCGSGRKFKSCCINGPTVSLEGRAGWLYHKAVNFALRPARRSRIEELFDLATEEARPDASRDLLPILMDVATFEGGALEEFLEQRGELLPADERGLAESWLGSRLALWEVAGVDPGRKVTLRDTRTGDRVDVTEHTASQSLAPGDVVLARVVPAGSEHQIMGVPLEIELRHRQSLLRLLDGDPEAEDWATWLGAAFAPPRFSNRESEDVVLCRGVFSPRSTPWDQLSDSLGRRFGGSDDGRWTETVDVDGETIVRAFLHREGDNLVVEANSAARYERLLGTLHDDVAADLEMVGEERRALPDAPAREQASGSPLAAVDVEEPSPEMTEILRQLVREKEEAWLDEQIPALGGVTPRQAAVDPTRREDLVVLLREFDRRADLPSGMATFDVARLRERLGISTEMER